MPIHPRPSSVLTALFALTAAASAGCGSSLDASSFTAGDDASADSIASDTGAIDALPTDAAGCTSDGACDDGLSCTIDSCVAGACKHVVGPASGATACPTSQFCNLDKGCIPCAAANQCGAACVDIATDDANCGACAHACSTASHCVAGSCTCPPGAPVCDGVCVDLKSDPKNCNGCGNTCAPGNSCVNGTCTCAAGTCGGKCTDLQTDDANCGACGKACTSGTTCQSGACKCPSGESLCNGACVDTSVDTANCGSCGRACAGVCAMGACQTCPVVDLFFLMDQSGSMGSDFAGGSSTPSKYAAVQTAIDAFALEPASSKLDLGLGFWPVAASSTTTPCMLPSDCLPPGVCLGGMCVGATSTDSCVAADYQKPAVGFAPEATSSGAMSSALAAVSPATSSTPPPGLEGTLAYVKQWAIANPTHKVALIAISDGAPNDCSMALADLNPIAAKYATGTPAVPTYVVALPNPGDAADAAGWNAVATAGGTAKAYLPMSAAEVQPTFDAIRGTLTTCK